MAIGAMAPIGIKASAATMPASVARHELPAGLAYFAKMPPQAFLDPATVWNRGLAEPGNVIFTKLLSPLIGLCEHRGAQHGNGNQRQNGIPIGHAEATSLDCLTNNTRWPRFQIGKDDKAGAQQHRTRTRGTIVAAFRTARPINNASA